MIYLGVFMFYLYQRRSNRYIQVPQSHSNPRGSTHDTQYGETALADNAWDSTIPTAEFRNELFDEIHSNSQDPQSQRATRIKTDERENLLENDELANANLQL